jgi:ribosomal protein L33
MDNVILIIVTEIIINYGRDFMFITVDNSQVHLVSNATRQQNYRTYSNNQPKERLINPKKDYHFVLLKAHYASEMIEFFIL